MSRTASQWNPSVKAPDLSKVLKQSGEVGRTSAWLEFYDELKKKEAERLEARDAEQKEKTAAKEDLGNEPESEGFWSKLGDNALEGLERTVDVLSRFNYASANTLDYVLDQDEDKSNKLDDFSLWGSSTLNSLDDLNLSDIGGALKAWGRGFAGKDKTTFAQVIAENAKENSNATFHDNKWYQGIAGFAGDVLLDPTTYIGVGLVTKPLRKGVDEAVDALGTLDRKAADLADNISKLPSPARPESDAGIGLTRQEVYTALTGKTAMRSTQNGKTSRTGMMLNRQADKVKRVNAYVQNVQTIKKQIRQAPDLDPAEYKKYDDAIDTLQAEYVSALDKYGKRAFREAAKRFDDSTVRKSEFQGNLLDEIDRATSVGTVAKAFEQYAQRLSKVHKTTGNKALKERKIFHEILGKGWKADTRLTDSQRDQILDVVERTLKNDKDYQDLLARQNSVWRESRGNLDEGIAKSLVEVDDPVRRTQITKNVLSAKKRAEATRKRYYNQMNLIRAHTFLNVVRHFVGDDSFMNKFKDIEPLLDEKASLEKALYDIKSNEFKNDAAPSHATVQASANAETGKEFRLDEEGALDDATPSAVGKQIVSDEVRDIENRLKELNDIIDEKVYRSRAEVPTPDEIDRDNFKLTEEWLANSDNTEFHRNVLNAVQDRKDSILNRLKQTYLRRGREARLAERNPLPEDIKVMFGGKNDQIPAITLNGQKVLKNDPKIKEQLLRQATEGDRATYRHLAEDAQNKVVDDVVEIKGDKKTSGQSIKDAVAASDPDNLKPVKTGFAVQSLEHIVFDRLFKKEWGVSVKEAISNKRFAEGKGLEVGTGKNSYVVTKNEFFDTVINAPGDVAIANFGWKVPFEGKGRLSWWQAKKKNISQTEYRKAFAKWVNENKTKPEFKSHVEKVFDSRLSRERAGKIQSGQIADYSSKIPAEKLDEFEQQARKEALQQVESEVKRGSLKYVPDENFEFVKALDTETAEELYRTAVDNARREYALKVQAEKLRNPGKRSTARETVERLDALKKERDAKIKELTKMRDEAIKTREAMADRMDEQLLLDLLSEPADVGGKHLRLSFANKSAFVPVPETLIKATESLSQTRIMQSTSRVWGEAFSPASRLSPELNEARLRAQGRVNDVLKHHLDEIFHTFNKYTPEKRRAALRAIIKGVPAGVDDELYQSTHKFFEQFLDYTAGRKKVGGETVTLIDLNHYLPEEFKFVDRYGNSVRNTTLNNLPAMFTEMRRLKPNTDPMKVLWSLRIAAEKAMAEKAMRFTIAESYGVKRILPKDAAKLEGDDWAEAKEKADLIEALKDKHNWTTLDGFDEKYYFPPESAEEISKLMKIMRPENTQEVMKVYDKALRIWKSTVTVYNPGYYTRNAIGETIMGLMDGVSNPKWYKKAASVIRYAMPDEVDEALKEVMPWQKFQTIGQAGARKVVKTRYGKELSAEEVWVLYHEHNLKSGFISTEYDHYFPSANTARSTPVGQVATKINDKVREKGEKFEDYFRLAHFMNRLARSGHRDVNQAAREAAEYVRKYHFDYTDFTPFEKTKMMRIFPFYKWTRKALPLMGGMLFTNPGKVLLYPKAMQNISYATEGSDPLNDPNGFMPNYTEVTPEWMRGLMAYPIGADAEGNDTFMNVATPQFDVYKMLQNPVSATVGMLTPLVKVPGEQLTGQTWDPSFRMDVKTGEDRMDHLMRSTPATSLVNSLWDKSKPGEDSAVLEPSGALDERLTSFLTGLGFYENNPDRQKGELMRRNLEGK